MNVASASRPELARDDAVEDDGVSGYYDQRCRDGRTGSSRAGQRIGTAVVVVARRGFLVGKSGLRDFIHCCVFIFIYLFVLLCIYIFKLNA